MSEMRLKAFFHDPFHKPLVLASGKNHEEIAKKLASAFRIILTDEELEILKGMDILASATERMVLPKNADKDEKYQVMNFEEIEFRHPMSGKAIPLNLNPEYYKRAERVLDEVLREFSEKLKDKSDTEKLEYLWHNLLPELIKRAPEIPWELLPADTRVPDHTIWAHLKLSTASQALKYEGKLYPAASLFIFTIGPVQSFIKKARKAQDFWAGSFMLSYLTFKAIEAIKNRYSSTVVIYPDPQAHPWILKENPDEITRPTIPNRFVALIPETNENEIKKIAEECENAVKFQVKRWSEEVLKKLQLFGNNEIQKAVERQIEKAFAFYWVALPLPTPESGKKDYQVALELIEKFMSQENFERAKKLVKLQESSETLYEPNAGSLFGFLYFYAEKALAARKTLRDKVFAESEPSNEAKATPKTRIERCHICGEKNAVVRRNRDGEIEYYDESQFIWTKINSQPDVGYRELPENEALCSVCLVKRFLPKVMADEVSIFPKDFSFPSVSDVAIADFLEGVLDEEEFKKFEEIVKKWHEDTPTKWSVKPIPNIAVKREEVLEGQWLFEASLQKEVVKRTIGVEPDEKELRKARDILQKLYENRKPCPYYAFIAIDGDQMGKWLAGEKGFEFTDETNIYHSKVWKNLPDEFKSEFKTIFQKGEAKLRPVTPAYHASIAKALQTFALKIAPKIVEEQYLGQLIYAGGDDILAFVNLRDLWKVLRLLRAAYSGFIKVNDSWGIEIDKPNNTGVVKTPNGYWLTMGPTATLSAGIVIAHYKTPLSVVISEGFSMEIRAKNALGRDAFSITWMKHSGEITVSGAKWNIGKEKDTIEQAEVVFDYFSKPKNPGLRKVWFSRRFLKEIRNLYEKLAGDEKTFDWESFTPLIKRALMRHANFAGKPSEEEKKKTIEEAYEELNKLLRTLNDIPATINLLEMGLLYKRFSNPEEE